MKKILVFSFSFIGDAVLSTTVIQPLRRHFRDAHITFLVGPQAFDRERSQVLKTQGGKQWMRG